MVGTIDVQQPVSGDHRHALCNSRIYHRRVTAGRRSDECSTRCRGPCRRAEDAHRARRKPPVTSTVQATSRPQATRKTARRWNCCRWMSPANRTPFPDPSATAIMAKVSSPAASMSTTCRAVNPATAAVPNPIERPVIELTPRRNRSPQRAIAADSPRSPKYSRRSRRNQGHY